MSSSYNYCSVCNITIQKIFTDIHLKDCHAILPPNCKSCHPLIKDGEMVSQVTFIKEPSINIIKNSQKIYNLEEPEFMKSFNYNFTENFAFFNELDLLESHIESFSHICVQVNSLQGVFIAVSTDRNHQQIGTVQFYVKGYEKHFKIHKNASYVTVRRINKVIEAKKVRLICSNANFVDEHLLYRFKNKFFTNYEYGWPYLFKKKGDAVVLQNLALEDFNIKIEIEDDDFYNVSMCSINFNPFGNVTLNETMDGSKDLSFTEGEKIKSMDISPERSDGNTSVKKTFRSSTPVGGKSNKSARLLTSTYLKDDDNSLVYYWMSRDTTKIEIVTSHKKEQIRDSIVEESEYQSQNYYKTKDFYLLKNLVQREFEIKPESSNPQMSRSGLLLMGFPGTGKNVMVEELSKELNIPIITLNILNYTRSDRPQNYIMDSFTEAQNNAPSILFFDFFDSFVHKKQNKFLDKILKALQQSKSLEKPVIFIGATNRPDLISPHVRQSGRFDKDLIISLPDAATRAEILLQMLDGEKHNINKEEAITLGKQALGFSPADLDLAVRTSWQKAYYEIESTKKKKANEDLCLQRKHVEDGIKEVVPSHLREKCFSVSKVLWQNIWGYEHIKERLKKVTKSLSSESCSKGILFYGPPGCSKTMMAKALATETQFSFFPIKCSDLLSKYVGETEKALCDMLEKAFLSSPSLVFIDEIDGLCGRRDDRGGAENSVVPELLSLMRKSYNSGNILFVGATNRPQVLDEVLLSAGYFELLFHVDLPNCESRCAIWTGLLEQIPHQNINIELLCSRTEGFTCAEICSIYQKAAYSLIETKVSDLESGHGALAQEDLKLTEDLILNALSSKYPRTSKSVLEAVRTFASARGSYK